LLVKEIIKNVYTKSPGLNGMGLLTANWNSCHRCQR